MSVLTAGWLAKASLAVHITAEDHWRIHGDTPVKVLLFTDAGTPELVQFAQGCGQDAAGQAIRSHAERIGAVALVITALATTTRVRLEPDVFARTALSELPTPIDAAEPGRSILTVTFWPERDLVKALSSDIRTTGSGAFELTPMLESAPTEPSRVAGLIAMLADLLPDRARAGTAVADPDQPATATKTGQ